MMCADDGKSQVKQPEQQGETSDHYDPFVGLANALEDWGDSDGKYRFKVFEVNHLFLPPVNQFAALLGLKLSPSFMLKMMESHSGLSHGLSKGSIANLTGEKGISRKSAEQFRDWFMSVAEPMKAIFDVPESALIGRAEQVRSNASNWLSVAVGVAFTGSPAVKGPPPTELRPLLQFVKKRAQQDIELFELARAFVKAKQVGHDERTVHWHIIKPYWQKNSLVPQAQLDAMERFPSNKGEWHELEAEKRVPLLAACLHLMFDFYLHMISAYEVGCVMQIEASEETLRARPWLLCRALSSFTDKEGKPTTCFGALLRELQGAASVLHGKPIGERDFARYIPIDSDPSNPSYESDSDRHYNVLKKWRSHQDLPSFERLELFITNVSRPVQPADNRPLVILCKIAIGLDGFVKQLAHQALNDVRNITQVAGVFEDVLARYPVYYQHHLDKQLEQAANS